MILPPTSTDAQQYWKAAKLSWNQRLRGGARSAILRMLGSVPGMPLAAPAGAFGILMYHRVSPAPRGLNVPTWNVPPQRLEQQLHGLLQRGFQPLRLSTLIDAHKRARPLPPKSFVVTFDDGYECVYQHALPLLKRLEIPATVFLATAYLDHAGPLPFDDWSDAGDPRAPAEAWRPLTAAQCAEMLASGCVELGAHTHWHEDYRGRARDFSEDLRICFETLHTRFGIEQPMFAFPYGSWPLGFVSAAMIEAVIQAGAVCALTTEPELHAADTTPFGWGRFNVEANDTAAMLAAQLLGWRCLWRRLAARGTRNDGGYRVFDQRDVHG